MTTAESADQRRTNRALAVDQAFRALDEYKIKRRRVAFISNDEKRHGGYGIVRKAYLRGWSYLPTWIGKRLYGQPQVVAVKEIKLSAMHDVSDLKRVFTKEVLVWSRIKGHPGVSRFIGFCADLERKEAWLISPWEPYGNVSEFINGRKLEVPERLSLAYDTIDALAFLHQLDPPVCHGDIKSPNVLVNSECRAVLCDFGLARLHEDTGFGKLESTAMIKGSIRWCSPELLEGHPRTASSDIYAWAWLVWEIMTGELPYGEVVAEYAIMRKIFEGPLPHVNGESRLSECLQLWDLVSRCWVAEPLDRPTSAMCETIFEYLPHCPPTPETADLHNRSPALLVNLGDLESWKGNHKAGFDYLEQALRLYEEEGNDKGIASVLRKQAAVAYRDSNVVKGGIAASAALKKCRSLRDDVGVADALYWMAYVEPNRGDALRDLQESLDISRVNGNSVGVAKCLQRLGDEYRHQGQPEKALYPLEEAVKVSSRCGDRLVEADALRSLGIAHQSLHQLDQAAAALQRAHDIARNIGWEHGRSSCLCRLGNVKAELGKHTEAEELLRESVCLARNRNAGWRLGQALYYLGTFLWAQGRHEEAITALEESYSVHSNIFLIFEPEIAHAAALLANSNSALRRKEDAIAWYDRAIAELRKDGDGREIEISKCLAAKDAILADMKRS